MHGLYLVARAEVPAQPEADAARELLRFFGDTSPVPRELSRSEAVALLDELAIAVAELASSTRARAAVRVGAARDAFELGLERTGDSLLVTMFQGGTIPEIAVHERRIDGDLLVSRLLAAIEDPRLVASDARLACARQQLLLAPAFAGATTGDPEIVAIEPTGEVSLVISADILLRQAAPSPPSSSAVLRADLLPLLFRGRIKVAVGDQLREVDGAFVFVVAEQLALLALEAAEAWARARPYYRRVVAGGAICGVRLGSQGAASLTIGVPRQREEARAQTWTFPAVDVTSLVRGVVAFGRALTRSLVRRDRSQAQNLRLTAFRAQIRELNERLREATRNDSKINDAPESYRAFAAAARSSAQPSDLFGKTRLRFAARWMAAVPSIDLRGTFLCGDRLIVGAAREVCSIDGKTGVILWKRPVSRAASVITPLGLARLESDGGLTLHDLDTGDVVWSTRLSPRPGAGTSGAVVAAPGLPKLMLVSEGVRHLAAVDLHTGEVRWRYAARRGDRFRLKRAGKLVIVASGETSLFALDVLTGDVVWRFCDRLRFVSPVAVDHDAAFALAGDGAFVTRGGTRLHHLDPWSGIVRWSVDLPPNLAPVGAPLLAPDAVVIATCGRRGTGLLAFDRRTGAPLFDQTVCTSAASCLVVDDTVLVNGEGGEVVAIDAQSGTTRYRHVFPCGAEGDRPRRLEPVLRSGALFVPQSEVQVIRPADGTVLGKVPNDIIPDLLRVDQRCDVYIAEESGHVAAYANLPRLSLVE